MAGSRRLIHLLIKRLITSSVMLHGVVLVASHPPGQRHAFLYQ
jgi:hypothetical protein